METPYRDDTAALTTRLGALLDELEVVRAQKRGLMDLTQAEEHIEQEIGAIRRKLEHATAGRRLSLVDQAKVASPCPADWESMIGDERKRFCGQCSKNVYNLSGMTREEAEAFLGSAVGDVCIRIFRRADGTVLTSDCPVGVRRKRRRRALVSLVGGSLVSAGALLAYSRAESQKQGEVLMGLMPDPPSAMQIAYQWQELARLLGERNRSSDPAERSALEARIRAAQQDVARIEEAYQRHELARLLGERNRTSDPAERSALEARIRAVQQDVACIEEAERKGSTREDAASAAGLAATAPIEAQVQEAILPFGEGMSRPVLISGKQPIYTREAREAKVGGAVLVKCIIHASGSVSGCRIIKGVPHMDEAVIAALQSSRYQPATKDGKPVSVDYIITIKLTLH